MLKAGLFITPGLRSCHLALSSSRPLSLRLPGPTGSFLAGAWAGISSCFCLTWPLGPWGHMALPRGCRLQHLAVLGHPHSCSLPKPSYQLAGFLLPLQALPQHHLHYHCIHSSQFTVDSWSWAFDSPKTALKILAFDPKYTGLTLLPGSTGQIRKSLRLYVPCQQSECPKFIRAAKI